MAGLENVMSEASEQYKEALYLSNEESKNDSASEPYKSKYKAREILHLLKCKVEDMLKEDPSDNRCILMRAVLDLRLGENYSETEEMTTGEEYLNKCIKSFEEKDLDKCKTSGILQYALNQIAYFWTGRRMPDNALEYLNKAEKLYQDYKHNVGGAPCTVDEIFLSNQEEDEEILIKKRSSIFENTFTHTLFYIAQVYGQLDDTKKSAEYCQVTLRRQLESNKYEPIDWALNAATLSQYYIGKTDFKLSRHCLASSTFILKEAGQCPESLVVETQEEDSQAAVDTAEKLSKSWADIYRCSAKYGLSLLNFSWERLLNQTDGEESGVNEAGSSSQTDNSSANVEAKSSDLFFNLELTSFESEISCDPILDFEQARIVFLKVQKWLNSAKEFYSLDNYSTDYAEIVQDHSRLYKLLAYFEQDLERQCKMHKRRIDMLESLLNELNPQFYLLLCRQLIYEAAETYSAIMDLKLSIIETGDLPPSSQQVKKINSLVKQSIDKFTAYLDTLKNTEKQFPQQFSDDDERPALLAFFYIGRLYSKFLEVDVSRKLTLMSKAIEYYNLLVDYCKTHPSVSQKIKAEKEICEELVVLLPLKMERIRAGQN